ncbi:hypothetical protein CI088_01995 [Enterococcus plantarum]|uniref:Uncharacterized protein n=1 Tax=Enterococcus plantarum TaxID=1077675 RepID=A0A2W4BIV3_9ENTE|nr:hypothetical protein [Enterococcus plantarum]PZL76975.1 hypothetical protein CI088_01995 [Enterococcus plantarum]
MEESKDLVLFFIYEDEDGYFETEIVENVIVLKEIKDIITEEETLVYTSADGSSDEISLDDVEHYRYVSHNSHLSNYIRSNDRADCEWDQCRNLISETK